MHHQDEPFSHRPRNDIGSALRQWEKTFRAEAEADHYACFHRLLEQVELDDYSPGQVLDGTIELVRASLAYMSGLDGQPFMPFLSVQQYNPPPGTLDPYAFFFEIHQTGAGRLFVNSTFNNVDLADLYGHPFAKYHRVGFSHLWILRSDYAALAPSECAQIERHVLDDLRYDYTEEEMDVSIESDWPNRLLVQIDDLCS